jgi:hypothetical protein
MSDLGKKVVSNEGELEKRPTTAEKMDGGTVVEQIGKKISAAT